MQTIQGSAPRRVLFLCAHNSARSQMAEGLLRALGGGLTGRLPAPSMLARTTSTTRREEPTRHYEVESAGTEQTVVRPEAVQAMKELGIHISRQRSKTLDRFLNEEFDEVITVCDAANETCPIFPRARNRRHWSIDDPTKAEGARRMQAFRRARDELRGRIETELLA